MSKRLIHTNSPIFFSNPYVLCVDYEMTWPLAFSEYYKGNRKAYRLLSSTWGYTTLQPETIWFKNNHPQKPGEPPSLESLFDSDFKTVMRGYICFKDKLDALQYRLGIATGDAKHVLMWPSDRKFAIYEIIETNDT